MRLFRLTAFLLALACGVAAAENEVRLLDPEQPIEPTWTLQSFGTPTRFRRLRLDDIAVIEANGNSSAGGLFRDVKYFPRTHPIVEWRWRVDRLPVAGDLRTKDKDDVAAAIFFIFGKYGFFRPEPQTLAYAWGGPANPKGSMIVSPRHPGTARTIILRSGSDELGQWRVERRDLLADYRSAFGTDPPEQVEVLAIWGDSDQTKDALKAYFGAIRALPR